MIPAEDSRRGRRRLRLLPRRRRFFLRNGLSSKFVTENDDFTEYSSRNLREDV